MVDQVIYNLLNNAAIHTSNDCKIEISVANHADLLHINIEDSGKGFNNADSRDVFEKFSRVKSDPDKTNSGLGLSIVKGFTEAMGGSVELLQSRSPGAKFSITLPVKNFKA